MKPIRRKIFVVWLIASNNRILTCLFLTRKAAVNYCSNSKLSDSLYIEERYAFNF